MADWRFGRGWTEGELRRHLDSLADRPVNFDDRPETMNVDHGWTIDGDSASLGTESEGPPEADGLYAHARQGIINYDFSDPSIVQGHFDPTVPLLGRDMLLEIKVFGLRYLGGVRVTEAREEHQDHTTLFGFRYDTLEGHIERGFEWFLLTKDHATGDVDFRIAAHWQMARFPNWWSRLGFVVVGNRFRSLWRHRAPERLRRLAQQEKTSAPVAEPGELAHGGTEEPVRTEPHPAQKAGR